MKKNIDIAGFEKSKSVNYSTYVTVTKAEKVIIVSIVAAMFAAIVISFIIKSILMFVLSIVFGVILTFGVVIFCIFRPRHRDERIQNSQKVKANIDYSYNIITHKMRDNSSIEVIRNNYQESDTYNKES